MSLNSAEEQVGSTGIRRDELLERLNQCVREMKTMKDHEKDLKDQRHDLAEAIKDKQAEINDISALIDKLDSEAAE